MMEAKEATFVLVLEKAVWAVMCMFAVAQVWREQADQ